jgi:hypothetical protein
MPHRTVHLLFVIAVTLVGWECALRPYWFGMSTVEAQQEDSSEASNEELARLYTEDQADRSPGPGKSIDWEVVSVRDKKREARVKEFYTENKLRSGVDYYHAAMVLQHAAAPEDYLLAHEFCVVAIGKGESKARWLAAATEDRFLMNIKRPQRFGTQYRSDGNGPLKLYEVDEQVTDELRRELAVPTLAKAKEREAEIQKLFKGESK